MRVPLDVNVRSNMGSVVQVMRVEYLEYAGESLADAFSRPNGSNAVEVLATVKSADAVLGVIDGHKLRRCLENDDSAEPGQGFDY